MKKYEDCPGCGRPVRGVGWPCGFCCGRVYHSAKCHIAKVGPKVHRIHAKMNGRTK